MTDHTCPDEAALLPLTIGEPVPATVEDHLRGCPMCRERVKQLQEEVSSLRQVMRDSVKSGAYRPAALPLPEEDGDAAPAETQGVVASSRRPANIGKYFIAGLLDTAETTLVYRALHPMVHKELIIKLGRQAPADDPALSRSLLDKGKALAQLEHPHLVRVHDLNFHERRPFLVLEYVGDSSLKQLVEDGLPGPVKAAALVAKVTRGLAEVHRKGLVHQEINPANIRLDDHGEPRLDFGLATLHERWIGDENQPAEVALTFMAPEQARGEKQQVGPRSDLFGLGSVLFFLLTGKAPFEGKDAFDSLDRLRRVDYAQDALHSSAIPRRLQAICIRALAADPSDRYATADEMAADLEHFVRHPRGYRVWVVVLAIVLVVAVGAGVAYWLLTGN
jgi:serine/threonine-protein kinase